MTAAAAGPVVEYLGQSRNAVQAATEDPVSVRTIERVVDFFCQALTAGCKIFLAGNAWSAGDTQHLAGEFLSRLNYDRAPAAAVALTTDSSMLTAIGNDCGYERVLERQILGLGQQGDVFLAISTSGRSPNILRPIDAARCNGPTVIGFTGRTGAELASRCDLWLCAPVDATPLIQQIHITADHVICGLVEERLFPRTSQIQSFRNAAE
jgi:D-sedoheptulose 7-phosphate isomerase